jgi:hypothetical protein
MTDDSDESMASMIEINASMTDFASYPISCCYVAPSIGRPYIVFRVHTSGTDDGLDGLYCFIKKTACDTS